MASPFGRRSPLRIRLAAVVVAVVAALLIVSPAWSGDCISAEITESFVLPDGSMYEAARIQICPLIQLTPVRTLHQIRVDGSAVGMFTGRPAPAGGDARAGGFVVFDRRPGAALELRAFALTAPSGDLRLFEAERPAGDRLRISTSELYASEFRGIESSPVSALPPAE